MEARSVKKEKDEESVKTEAEETVKTEADVKVIDQGMHWCRDCNTFFDKVPAYVKHLLGPEHVGGAKVGCCR